MSQSVACVVDVASRAAELSGEAFELTVQSESVDGVEYVRLVTDPASIVMPLSAFRYIASWARALQWQPMDEAPKDGTAIMYIYKLDGAFAVSTMQWMQTWSPSMDESSSCWWDMQIDDEAYKPLGWMLAPVWREPNSPPDATREKD